MPSKTAGASLHPYTAKNSRRVVPLLPTPLRLSFIDGKVHITPAGVNDTTVSFIEMARSTLPLFTLGALYLAGLEHPNGQLIRSVLLIVVGCLISAYGE
eukprot:scaffold148910_cov18-Tisochrysis_lutea.AAC.1